MSKLTEYSDVQGVQSWEELRRQCQINFASIVDLLNGRVGLIDNCSTQVKDAAFTAPDADIGVQHGLNRIPNGYLIIGRSAALTVYDGTQKATNAILYLRASAIGTAQVLIF